MSERHEFIRSLFKYIWTLKMVFSVRCYKAVRFIIIIIYFDIRYPRKVTKKMSKKKVAKRSAIKPFLKV